MKKQRLLKLADLLEADAANKKGIKFNLSTWAADTHGVSSSFGVGETVPVDCSTQACAVGLACLSGAFKRSGLGYDISFTGQLHPTFDGDKGWYAVQYFFGLTEVEAYHLFSADRYPENKRTAAAGERFVAKRIRKFVEDGKVTSNAR